MTKLKSCLLMVILVMHLKATLGFGIEEAQAKGIAIDAPLNAHWNSNGHSLAGEIILNYLIEHDLLNKK